MEDRKEKFAYQYSSQVAGDKEEVKKILKQYIPPEENLLEQLRKLDEKAKQPGTIAAMALGVVGSLIFGTGMCLVMVWDKLFLGSVVGILGMGILGTAYPVYQSLLKKGKAKYASEILRISESMLKM